MGSQIESNDELTVLVTGFAPFKAQYPVNPSWEIARSLPAYLPPLRAKDPNAKATSSASSRMPPVRILVHPAPVRVNYQVVRALVSKLWDQSVHPKPPRQHPNPLPFDAKLDEPEAASSSASAPQSRDQPTHTPSSHHPSARNDHDDEEADKDDDRGLAAPPRRIDLMIHIGMAGPRHFHSIERRGHRDGYLIPDVDGERLEDEARRKKEGERWVWHGEPHELETDLDLDDVLDRWRRYSPNDADLRISEDAGRYLCDFIYFSSLAHLHRRREYRRVVFLHVPADAGEDAVAKGRELTVQLIRSIVESEVAKGDGVDLGDMA